MTSIDLTPARLAVRLVVYFVLFFGLTSFIVSNWPESVSYMPLAGHDALDSFGTDFLVDDLMQTPESLQSDSVSRAYELTSMADVLRAAVFLLLHLGGTVLLMIPLTWTYMSAKQEVGYHKSFVRALIVLPICAATIVLLIQDSLALAFGLAALVAAVRFRVALAEAIDGIFIFAAICVGLSAGVGYLGIATVMTVFFCFASLVLWQLDYGSNPIEQAQQERKRIKLERKDGETDIGSPR
jgi:hypothetical protein